MVRATLEGVAPEVLYLNSDDFMKAKFHGKTSILDLIYEGGCPPGMERMVRGSVEGGYPLLLDGEEVHPAAVAVAFWIDMPGLAP